MVFSLFWSDRSRVSFTAEILGGGRWSFENLGGLGGLRRVK